MITQEEMLKARKKAMHLLEYSPCSQKTLTDKLIRSGFSQDAAENAVEYVKSFGYLNDIRYAESYILSAGGRKSRSRLLQELHMKGVDSETARSAMENVLRDFELDEMSMVRALVLKKAEEGSRITDKKMRSIIGSIVRKGFRFEQVMEAFHELQIDRLTEI